MHVNRDLMLRVFWSTTLHPYPISLSQGFSLNPELGWWPVSSTDPPVSTVPAYVIHGHTQHFMQLLRTKLRASGLHSERPNPLSHFSSAHCVKFLINGFVTDIFEKACQKQGGGGARL